MKMQSPKKLFHMRKSTPLFCALLLSLSARRAWIEIANDFNSNANSSSNSNTTQDDKNNTKENRDGNEHRVLDHVEKGYRGRSLVSIMNDYMKENTNIYNCLYRDMEVLFMRLW